MPQQRRTSKRPPQRRDVYLIGSDRYRLFNGDELWALTIHVTRPAQDAGVYVFPAYGHSDAVCKLDLLRQGAFVLPVSGVITDVLSP